MVFGFVLGLHANDKNRSNEVTGMLFVCAKEGKYIAKIENDGVVEVLEENDETEEDEKVIPKKRARSCSTIRCGCKARLQIKYDKWSNKWKVTVFSNANNHPLVTHKGDDDASSAWIMVVFLVASYRV
ncbi:hypothetical protein RHMOL_Rhmol01G0225400 [Rhododendron molle]|uniref:Uncharacterized protein n=1 Tax=Rhododendron molle TaxID=49168 RepID=A0ACC0Q6B6_RHOML|nr:hypothetical protein RHMOL_Rhmol01G0225400 [Rhododendron molle]